MLDDKCAQLTNVLETRQIANYVIYMANGKRALKEEILQTKLASCE